MVPTTMNVHVKKAMLTTLVVILLLHGNTSVIQGYDYCMHENVSLLRYLQLEMRQHSHLCSPNESTYYVSVIAA